MVHTVIVYRTSLSIRLHGHPLGCKNKSAGADRVHRLGDDRNWGTHQLRERGGWVIDVTVRVLQAVEGRTLVSRQRDTELDAQWQVGLE